LIFKINVFENRVFIFLRGGQGGDKIPLASPFGYPNGKLAILPKPIYSILHFLPYLCNLI